jgi:hypothetical protein
MGEKNAISLHFRNVSEMKMMGEAEGNLNNLVQDAGYRNVL